MHIINASIRLYIAATPSLRSAYGLAVDARGDLYAAVPPGLNSVVYRIDRRGDAVLLPGADQIVRANALAFDQTGKLYVSESHSGLPPFVGQGGIWRIPRVGVAELLLQDNPFTEVGGIIAQVPVGANGIAFYQGDLYVANSDKGTIVRIQALPDGSPWKPEV